MATKTTKTAYAILVTHPDGSTRWHARAGRRLAFARPEEARRALPDALCLSPGDCEELGVCHVRVVTGAFPTAEVEGVAGVEPSAAGVARTRRAYLAGTTAVVVRLEGGRPVEPDGTAAG